MPCILNAANEVAVQAFLDRRIRFTDMPRLVRKVMDKVPCISAPTLDDLISTNAETLRMAREVLPSITAAS